MAAKLHARKARKLPKVPENLTLWGFFGGKSLRAKVQIESSRVIRTNPSMIGKVQYELWWWPTEDEAPTAGSKVERRTSLTQFAWKRARPTKWE